LQEVAVLKTAGMREGVGYATKYHSCCLSEIGVPGPWCVFCGSAGGSNDSGESGPGNSVLASDESGFPNRSPGTITSELETAAALDVQSLRIGDPELGNLFQNTSPEEPLHVKWAVSANGELGVIPHSVVDETSESGLTEISHTVIFRGANVLAAGEAWMFINADGAYELVWIDNRSGHYFNDDIAAFDAAMNDVDIPAFRHARVIVPGDLGF